MSKRNKRIVSFLGTGSYKPTLYRIPGGGTPPAATRFFVAALAEIERPDEVVLLETQQARLKNGKDARAALKNLDTPPRVRDMVITAAGDQLWSDFKAIVDSIVEDEPKEVILDVTHGFRSMPIFASAATSYVKAVVNNPPVIRIVYGCQNFAPTARPDGSGKDSPPPDESPVEGEIWNLSPFLDLVRWGSALESFLSTANPTALARLVGEVAEERDNDGLRRLADSVRDFGAHLATLRMRELLSPRDAAKPGSAARLLDDLDKLRPTIEEYAPPLNRVIDQVERILEPLPASSGVFGDSGRPHCVALARLFLDAGRFMEAAATTRERLVSLLMEPGDAGDANIKTRRQLASRKAGIPRKLEASLHDLIHGGFRNHPTRAQEFRKVLETTIGNWEHLDAPTKTTSATPTDSIFLNISNHASAGWPDEQKQAALKMASRIVDIQFPCVRPDASGKELSRECVARVLEEVRNEGAGASHAMVMGEFNTCFAIVHELQKMGIDCYAATTRREVTPGENDTVTKRFSFVKFREYLPLCERTT